MLEVLQVLEALEVLEVLEILEVPGCWTPVKRSESHVRTLLKRCVDGNEWTVQGKYRLAMGCPWET